MQGSDHVSIYDSGSPGTIEGPGNAVSWTSTAFHWPVVPGAETRWGTEVSRRHRQWPRTQDLRYRHPPRCFGHQRGDRLACRSTANKVAVCSSRTWTSAVVYTNSIWHIQPATSIVKGRLMLWHVKRFILLSCLLGFLIFVVIIFVLSATDIFMGSSESADRLLKYIAMGQSGSVLLLALCLIWVKESGVRAILFPWKAYNWKEPPGLFILGRQFFL